jgi:ABC-type transport system involved in multi-copper enzyme maturation permease subunit
VHGATDGGPAGSGSGTVTPNRTARGATLRLLRKDAAAFRPRYVGLVTLIYVMAALQAVRHEEALFTLGVMLAVALAVAVPAIEWRLGTDRLLASLPVRRSTLVHARYVAAGLAVALAWAAWVSTDALLAPFLAPDRQGPGSWATPEGNAAFLALCMAILAIFLPLFFRLGLGRAASVFLPVLVALYGLAAAMAAVPGGGIRFVAPGALARSVIAAPAGAWGWPAAAAVVVSAMVGVVALSLGLSTGAFRRRDL